MAKDSIEVLKYYILAYLYMQLKKGNAVDTNYIELKYYPAEISYGYWLTIMKSLVEDGYIEGVKIESIPILGQLQPKECIKTLQHIKITVKGMMYVDDEATISKVKTFIEKHGGLLLDVFKIFF